MKCWLQRELHQPFYDPALSIYKAWLNRNNFWEICIENLARGNFKRLWSLTFEIFMALRNDGFCVEGKFDQKWTISCQNLAKCCPEFSHFTSSKKIPSAKFMAKMVFKNQQWMGIFSWEETPAGIVLSDIIAKSWYCTKFLTRSISTYFLHIFLVTVCETDTRIWKEGWAFYRGYYFSMDIGFHSILDTISYF